MRNVILTMAALVMASNFCYSQPTPNQTLNLSFENTNANGQLTGVNFPWNRDDYFAYRDDSSKVDGKYAMRLEKNPASTKAGFGTVSFSLPANFKGKVVKLKGYIKTEEVKDGYAGLWLRTDAGTQMVGFDNMSNSGVTGTMDWKQYAITVPMDENVTGLVFGGLFTGKGKAWFDKFELLIDDKTVESITWIPGKIPAEKKELEKSTVRVDSLLNRQQIQNLYVLAKVWGFLKYHHPEVAKGNYNFDSCLFSIMPSVLIAKATDDRDKLILSWIATLGTENAKSDRAVSNSKNIHTRPNLGWMSNNDLISPSLSARLNEIYQNRNSKSNFYVRMAPGVGNPIFDKEAAYKTVTADDDGFRMLALFRYWNMIEYFFPYKHLFKENWNDVLKEFIPQFSANRTTLGYHLTCLRLINRVHDTHASIYGDAVLSNYFGTKSAALDFKSLNNKIIVTAAFNDSLAAFETLRPGDEITEVNGKKIADIRAMVEPYICASNASVADRNFIDRFLFRSNDDSLNITYVRDGKPGKTIMRLYGAGKVAYQNGDTWKMPMYKLLSPEIGYVNLGKISADSLPVIFKSFESTKGIVIDIRNYPKEFMPFALGEYLKTTQSPFVKFTAGDINNPGTFTFTETISNGPGKQSRVKPYKGSIVILINEQSQSQAEYTTMALRSADRAIVIGSQTAGADGNISYVPFPGGFSSPFSGIGVFYPDGKETQGVGIIPNIVMLPTQKGITEGKDELLDSAQEYIRKAKAF